MAEKELRFTFRPQPSYGFFWVEFEGDFDMQRLGLAYGEFISHPDYYPGIDELLDFSKSTLEELTVEDIARLKAFTEARPELRNNKSVIVVNSALEYQLAETLKVHMQKTIPVDRHICFSVREAIEWLRPEQADEINAKLLRSQT